MSDYVLLEKIINPHYKPQNQKELTEKKDPKRPMTIRIVNKRNDIKYTLFRFDPDNGEIFPFFNIVLRDLRKICDYILLGEKNNCLYILLIELKYSGSGNCQKQLEASKCFVEYLINSAKRISKYGPNKFSNVKPKIRTIRICNSAITKRTHKLNFDYDSSHHLNLTCQTFNVSKLLN